jgi:hypothetical protein
VEKEMKKKTERRKPKKTKERKKFVSAPFSLFPRNPRRFGESLPTKLTPIKKAEFVGAFLLRHEDVITHFSCHLFATQA